MKIQRFRSILIIFSLMIFAILFVIYRQEHLLEQVLSPLINQFYPTNFSTLYTNLVLLSCSSDSYNSVYCYYLPYVALAWRRIGFEPIVFLVGNDEIFRRMPLLNLLENDLKITYHFYNVDSSHSISTSQLIRLFGGFLSYNVNTTKDLFIIISDVDLVPISRRRFELRTSTSNSILAVNAFCCLGDRFSFGNYQNLHYYPMSYIGMKRDLWRQLFLPLNECNSIGNNLTIDLINCCLKQHMNETIPKNVIKARQNWDLDQRFLSILIARTQRLYQTEVDKRPLGHRLDPKKNFLLEEFDRILQYDDVHLPNTNENLTFTNHTWLVFQRAFSKLFHSDIIDILSEYHQQTTAYVETLQTAG